ncbi:MAG: thiosulfate oxidation carrier complex protein SoxZ [Gammaproteobacteria bacterium]
MASQIKIRATLENGVTTVKTLMIHPMETGLFKDKKTGDPIPAHFIKEVKCEHNGKVVVDAEYGIAISKNPYMAFNFNGGAHGDTIKISWVDNRGAGDSAETTIT